MPARVHSDAQKLAFATQIESMADPNEQMRAVREFLADTCVTVRSVAHVSFQGLAIRGRSDAGTGPGALMKFDSTQDAHLTDCAILGQAENGIVISNGSSVEIRNSLIAAVWGTGVAVAGGGEHSASVHLSACDVRNCYYAGVRLSGGSGSAIEHCRISGAAWHGIRYDDTSPTITDNLIFGNARSGIYASGTTHAKIHGNLFWRNEMDAISCWFDNTDTIEQNTIVHNLREGICVCGDARPALSHNIVAANPVGISCVQIDNHGQAGGDPQPTIGANLFWQNDTDLKRLLQTQALPAGNDQGDPGFVNEDASDYSLKPDSTARKAGIGASDIPLTQSPWPVQSAESAMIPDGDTRDYTKWHKPAGIQ